MYPRSIFQIGFPAFRRSMQQKWQKVCSKNTCTSSRIFAIARERKVLKSTNCSVSTAISFQDVICDHSGNLRQPIVGISSANENEKKIPGDIYVNLLQQDWRI